MFFAAKPKVSLEDRVIRAAQEALAAQHSVSAIDVLSGMGLLSPVHVETWRKGRLPFLADMIQGSYEKVGGALKTFRRWAEEQGLEPAAARYLRNTPDGPEELKLTGVKYAGLEDGLRLQYLSRDIPEKKKQKLQERISKPAERVVFLNRRDAACSECGIALPSGSMLYLEKEQALCLACSGMGELEFLPRGDVALTRRATKYSELMAVVVEHSRSRGRYERQGILVTEAAVRRAEEECVADAPERARQRERAAESRIKADAALVEQMTRKIGALFPGCPPQEAARIAAHTALRGSGRVGRSEAGRQLDSDALTLAVIAAVRHHHTKYDELLASGVDRADARERVRPQIELVLDHWRWGVI